MHSIRSRFLVLSLVALVAFVACDDGPNDTCEPMRAVVTDIDETLTTSNAEWVLQMVNPAHVPEMRPAASDVMNAYTDLGYAVFYVTARGESDSILDGTTAREATEVWLRDMGFPLEDGHLFLAPGNSLFDEDAVAYKSEVVESLEDEGWTVDWAYGNAESDILAFQAAGIPDERIFLVGELAGTMGVQPLPDEDAYEAHLAEHLPEVPPASCH